MVKKLQKETISIRYNTNIFLSLGFMCLWCNEKGRTFHSADSARQHMLDKGHCKMIHEGVALAEYADFYDYSSSYPDAEKETVNTDEEVSNALHLSFT